MKHNDDEWEKIVRQEPFASSSFNSKHKDHVIRRITDMKTHSESYKHTSTRIGSRRSRIRWALAGTAVAVMGAGILLWNGQMLGPVMNTFYPASMLQLSDDPSLRLLNDKVKKTVAIAMRDLLGKQLLIKEASQLDAGARIYVNAEDASRLEFAWMWLDPISGKMFEMEMKREMNVSEVDQKLLAQVPALLDSIGIDSSLKPVSASRYVKLNEGEKAAIAYTTLELEHQGQVRWDHDKLVSVSGEVKPERISTVIPASTFDSAERLVRGFSGESAPSLTKVYRTEGENLSDLSFTYNGVYNVVVLKQGSLLTSKLIDMGNRTEKPKDREELKKYDQKLLNIKEETLRDSFGPIIQRMYGIDIALYEMKKDTKRPGFVTFEKEDKEDRIIVSYDVQGTIQSVIRENQETSSNDSVSP